MSLLPLLLRFTIKSTAVCRNAAFRDRLAITHRRRGALLVDYSPNKDSIASMPETRDVRSVYTHMATERPEE